MQEQNAVACSIVTFPAHRYLHIKRYDSDGYFDFWEKQDQVKGLDCDTVTALLDRIRSERLRDDKLGGMYPGQLMGRLYEGEKDAEAYGILLPSDCEMAIPEGMKVLDVERTDYLVFQHDAFDYEKDAARVYGALRHALDHFDYESVDFAPDCEPGRVRYYVFDPDWGAAYMVPIKGNVVT